MFIHTLLSKTETLTMDKLIRMHEVLVAANYVYKQAAQMYAARYPAEENPPSRQSFRRYLLN